MADKPPKKSSRLEEIAHRQITLLKALLHPVPSAQSIADSSNLLSNSAFPAPKTAPQTTPLSTHDPSPIYSATTHSEGWVYPEKPAEITTPVIAEPPLKNTTALNTTALSSNTLQTLKPIQSRLRSGVLAALLAPTYRLLELHRRLLSLLPPDYHSHSTLVRLDTKAFILQTDSSAWATRLRFALPDVMAELSHYVGFAVPRPRIRVATAWQPMPETPPINPPRRLRMSPETAQVLEAAALGCQDKRLADAFKRLARHACSVSK